MALTLEAVQKEIDALGGPLDMESLALCLSHGSLMGARGNSGVILSQILPAAWPGRSARWRPSGRSMWPRLSPGQ